MKNGRHKIIKFIKGILDKKYLIYQSKDFKECLVKNKQDSISDENYLRII